MDSTAKYHYEVVFERDFLKKKGEEYQDFFSTIMEKCYPGDFIRTRPWGNLGDRKNDGYIRSKRILFQVYAPNEMSAKEALKKINEDYEEAKPYWTPHFDQWVFVHNSRNGLGPEITRKLLELDKLRPPNVTHWGYQELWNEASQLDDINMQSLFGPAISWKDMLQLSMENIRHVLSYIAENSIALDTDLRPFRLEDKIQANGLSLHVQNLLKLGMQGSFNVKNFFSKWHDVTYGERIAEAFKKRYVQLKDSGESPDQIFIHLWEFAGGREAVNPGELVAVYAILFYFFENCDIFERPREGIGDDSSN
ncbi:MAG: hypothetical protein K8L99_33055 [Anaerolineae bacterium]|nr:hypothetical protein [Anaerolineae bacterium]